jgi:hypothetical protein
MAQKRQLRVQVSPKIKKVALFWLKQRLVFGHFAWLQTVFTLNLRNNWPILRVWLSGIACLNQKGSLFIYASSENLRLNGRKPAQNPR